ncbi:unnamed protein product [Thlaspi arvense]|uniref:Isopenicillin N synthase-like Fe(2+) 2OG dioxygenase domain-containing protein n=1 Tax=Thlaspi arvense TaxID=13288 RepID=A0AAU9SSU8_THLAR|nr:unnamed protein product [Thlaspi arvense]
MKQQQVSERLFKAIARSLGLEDNCFLEMCGENATLETRFNMYPPCPRVDNVLGFKPHADESSLFSYLTKMPKGFSSSKMGTGIKLQPSPIRL